MNGSRWLVSGRFDAALFIGPAMLSLLVLAVSPRSLFLRDDLPVWAWVVLIPVVDVGHVYASLYRTYLDRAERLRRPTLYAAVPGTLFLAATMLYAVDAAWFWRLLAYLAVWHFMRQQYGFLALYRYRCDERGRWEGRLDAAALYLSMLYPLAYWHTHLPRKFVWFVDGDFLPLPAAALSETAAALYGALAIAYVVKETACLVRGRPFNAGKNLLLLATALTWYVGIVYFNSDYSFSVTNVVSHGVPYVALVWIYCRRKWGGSDAASWIAWLSQPRRIGAFVGLLLALALLEEGLWDVLVWGDHPGLFGGRNHVLAMTDSPLLPFVVALLALPQATHYVLDGFIWKMNASNPDLKRYLFS
jgi:hypothetical protein